MTNMNEEDVTVTDNSATNAEATGAKTTDGAAEAVAPHANGMKNGVKSGVQTDISAHLARPASERPLILLQDVVKAYDTPAGDFLALRGINLAIDRGEFVAVVGKSGSGKSTLINMLTGIDRPTRGEIFIGDTAIHKLEEGPMAEWRGRTIGIIFQFFQLLPMLTCIENVMLPMDFCNIHKSSEREAKALDLLDQVEMADHAYKLPNAISGGQQQRVAIARAMANDPPLIVADEPTGNLDTNTASSVFRLFERMVDQGKTILMVTHDDELAHRVHYQITLVDGEIVEQHGVDP
ncbi:MAG: ABC transporter ATP-binding protein [Litorilinea sp.]